MKALFLFLIMSFYITADACAASNDDNSCQNNDRQTVRKYREKDSVNYPYDSISPVLSNLVKYCLRADSAFIKDDDVIEIEISKIERGEEIYQVTLRICDIRDRRTYKTDEWGIYDIDGHRIYISDKTGKWVGNLCADRPITTKTTKYGFPDQVWIFVILGDDICLFYNQRRLFRATKRLPISFDEPLPELPSVIGL